jgi:AcrR family transcriptional regulator
MHVMKPQLIAVATKLAEKTPLHSITRGAIAKRAKVAPSLVSYYIGTMDEMRADIVHEAIKTNNVGALASAMRANHPGVANAPKAMKMAAAKILAV